MKSVDADGELVDGAAVAVDDEILDVAYLRRWLYLDGKLQQGTNRGSLMRGRRKNGRMFCL